MKYPKAVILSGVFILFVAATFGALGFGANSAHAATAPVALAAVATTTVATTTPAATCGVTAAQINQIGIIQNDPLLTYTQEIQQELALRKQLVAETIGCAEKDVKTLHADLESATTTTDSQGLQSQLLGDLNQASSFYTLELAKLNGVGVSGSEAIAQEVLDWRQNTFIPLSENVNNFILWSRNQNLFTTAQTRIDQTQSAVSFLEVASPNAPLQSAFDAAASSFSQAQSQNAEAKNALAQGLSPDQSLMLIKQSLASLSTTYQDFSTISTLIKGILPQ